MPRPVRGYALIENVLQIPPRAALHQQPDDLLVAVEGGLMQRGRMGMASHRIVAVGVLPGVEEQADDLRVAMLGGQGEGAVPLLRRGGGERLPGLREAAPRGGGREGPGRAPPLSGGGPRPEAAPRS